MRAVLLANDGRTAMVPSETTGDPVIGYALDALRASKLVDVIVTLGSEARRVRDFCMLERPEIFYTFVGGEADAGTGTAFGVHCACEELGGDGGDDVIFVNGNIAFEPRLLASVGDFPGSCLAVDWGTFDEAAFKATVRDGRILSLARRHFEEESFGRSVGLFKFTDDDLPVLLREVGRGMDSLRERTQPFETVLDRLLLGGVLSLQPCKTGGARWTAVAAAPAAPGAAPSV